MTMSITSSTFGKRTYKIVLLGDTNTGKTSIIQRFVNNAFDPKENPTIGIDFLGKNVHHKGTTCRLQLWDTAGQERFKSLIPTYLKDAVCAIFVFDVSKNQSLQNMEQWIEMFREHRGDKTVAIVCGNKCDLDNDYNEKALSRVMEKFKLPFEIVSAKFGDNIETMFHKIIDMINELQTAGKKRRKRLEEDDQFDNPPLTKDPIVESSHRHDESENKDGTKLVKTIEGEKGRNRCCG